MKLIISVLIISLGFIGFKGYTQTTYNLNKFEISKRNSNTIRDIKNDYQVSLQNLEPAFEGNRQYKSFLEQLKAESAILYPYKPALNTKRTSDENFIDTPMVHYSFEGNKYNNSAPNDNTIAVSKNGIALAAINTNLIFYDVENDSLLKTISLNIFSDTLSAISTHQYDPKVIYDYQKDRFILVNLSGASSDNTTHIVVAFQLTPDVLGEWAFYAVPGNPLNDTSWTDFPAMSLTDNELFITGNLLRYGGSWQMSFKQSVIWQIDKNSGFKGDTILKTNLFSGIKYNGNPIRNLHPVMGGDGFFGPEMYFMSNRNFSIQSDTFFLLKTSGLLSDPSNNLSVKLIKSNNNYGAPPNPRMPGNKRLATNDARVLGAILQNNVIQFVGNTIDTTNGYATIYHGLIYNPDTATVVKLTLFKNDTLQFGYPNISYCGTYSRSLHSIINFNFADITVNPGFGVVFFGKEGEYSDMKVLKEGETYIDVLFGSLQRWGDYTGSQPDYDNIGKVWVCGTYGKANGGQRIYGTWISQVETTVEDESVYPLPKDKMIVYPNPVTEQMVSFVFTLTANQNINVQVVDINGKVINLMNNYPAKQGVNNLTFVTTPLAIGTYILKISSDKEILFSSKLIVAD